MSKLDDLAAWRYLIAFAKTGTLSAAADLLGVDVSNISRAIAGLEKALGCELIRHNSRPMDLSETGKLVVKRMTPIVKAHDSLMQKIIDDNSALTGNIRLSSAPGFAARRLTPLLQRFYDMDGGSLRVEGVDVRDWDRAALRGEFAMVLQDTWLFKGTIMENIRYGRLDATDEEVIAAAKAANADHFIRTLPGGYQMELNEDASNVSQGQKQLLTIARTILADNRILILDEATSSVDTRTEQRIQTAMDRLMQGRTSFVIAHRLSTIRDADLILVMRDGDIVEQGTHDELIDQGGFYADLYNSQFEDVTA